MLHVIIDTMSHNISFATLYIPEKVSLKKAYVRVSVYAYGINKNNAQKCPVPLMTVIHARHHSLIPLYHHLHDCYYHRTVSIKLIGLLRLSPSSSLLCFEYIPITTVQHFLYKKQ